MKNSNIGLGSKEDQKENLKNAFAVIGIVFFLILGYVYIQMFKD